MSGLPLRITASGSLQRKKLTYLLIPVVDDFTISLSEDFYIKFIIKIIIKVIK